jgi:hypothetical protein
MAASSDHILELSRARFRHDHAVMAILVGVIVLLCDIS